MRVLLMALCTLNFAFASTKAQTNFGKRLLSDEEFVILVCFGQGRLSRDRTADLLGLNPNDTGGTQTCKQVDSCDHALQQTFVGQMHERDGDGDGVPCENMCLIPSPFNQKGDEGSVGWNCEPMWQRVHPTQTLDDYNRQDDLEKLNQSP